MRMHKQLKILDTGIRFLDPNFRMETDISVISRRFLLIFKLDKPNVHHIWNPWPRFAYSLHNFYGCTIKTNWVIRQNSVWPCVKDHIALCTCAKSCQPWTLAKSLNTVILGEHDFPLMASNSGNLTTFRAIFSHIFTAHMQKWLLTNFWIKFWRWRSIPYRALYFGNLSTFSVDWCIG